MSRVLRISGRVSAAAVVTLVLALASPVRAVDGVIEISQVCAESTGCSAGDAPGFPVTIDASGSYVLTSNLDSGLGAGIQIDAGQVVLDLNGFSIVGSGAGPFTRGIEVSQPDVTIRNGRVQGFPICIGDLGISATSTRIERMQVRNCSLFALNVSTQDVVRANQIEDSNTGIAATDPSALYSENFLANNQTHINGGTASGPNFCDGVPCAGTGFPQRRYYLTTGDFDGAAALTACDSGFHMASLFEIISPSVLRYDGTRGLVSFDSGSGPPHEGGWIRTGFSSGVGTVPGQANCDGWSSASGGDDGTLVRPYSTNWTLTGGRIDPWEPLTLECDRTEPVWCIED